MTACLKERDGENKTYGATTMGNVLKRLVKRRLALVLQSLKMRTTKRDFKAKFLKRMLKHRAEERYRHYFNRWKQCSKLMQIADDVNVSGTFMPNLNSDRRSSCYGTQHAAAKG